MSGNYDDIIGLPHHTSESRPRMPRQQRAAQFSAFAALKGFDEEIEETARYTEEERDLAEERVGEIAQTLEPFQKEGGWAEVVYFAPDPKKKGGAYLTKRGRVLRADKDRGALLFEDGEIPFSAIVSVERLT